jgi:hypothetical protein
LDTPLCDQGIFDFFLSYYNTLCHISIQKNILTVFWHILAYLLGFLLACRADYGSMLQTNRVKSTSPSVSMQSNGTNARGAALAMDRRERGRNGPRDSAAPARGSLDVRRRAERRPDAEGSKADRPVRALRSR